VDLPTPFGPTTPMQDVGAMVSETSFRTVWAPRSNESRVATSVAGMRERAGTDSLRRKGERTGRRALSTHVPTLPVFGPVVLSTDTRRIGSLASSSAFLSLGVTL